MLFAYILQAAAPKAPQWYEQVSGILAIPVTIIGVAYSYVLIKKTRLEARKTELEIQEKELAAREKAAVKDLPGESYPAPSALVFSAGTLILRYVLLELLLSLSAIVRQPLSYFFRGVAYGIYVGLQQVTTPSSIGEAIPYLLMKFGDFADTILYWLIFFVVGWPLLKDILVFFGVSTKEMGVKAVFASMKDWRSALRKIGRQEAEENSTHEEQA